MSSLMYYQYNLYIFTFLSCNLFIYHLLQLILYIFYVLSFIVSHLILLIFHNLYIFHIYTCIHNYVLTATPNGFCLDLWYYISVIINMSMFFLPLFLLIPFLYLVYWTIAEKPMDDTDSGLQQPQSAVAKSWAWLIDLERACALLIGRCLGGMLIGAPMSPEERDTSLWLSEHLFSNGLQPPSAEPG